MNKIIIFIISLSLIITSLLAHPDTFVVAKLPGGIDRKYFVWTLSLRSADDFDLSQTEGLSEAAGLGLGMETPSDPEATAVVEDNKSGDPGEGWARAGLPARIVKDHNQKWWWNKILSLNLISWFETK